MQYSMKELDDELDFVKEKLKDTQEEFEQFKDAQAEIWTRHYLTRYEDQDLQLVKIGLCLACREKLLVSFRLKLNCMS